MEIRWTEERDLDGISTLFEAGFGRELSRQEWLWKYRALPGEARSAVAVDERGQVLAHAGAIGLPAQWSGSDGSPVSGDPGLLWQTVDFVASPRQGGLRPPVVPLMRWIIEDLPRSGDAPWIIGFPSPRNRRLTERVLRSGWLRAIRRWEGDLSIAAEAAPPGLEPIEIATGDSTFVGVPETASQDDTEWCERAWRSCVSHGIRRTAGFLNWRYHARPNRFFRFYRLRSRQGSAPISEGLAVVAFAGTEAALTELWLPPGGDWRGALPGIAADLLATGLERWRMWTPPGGETVLAGLGMRALDEIHVAYRGRVGQALTEVEAAAQQFFYCAGDYDYH